MKISLSELIHIVTETCQKTVEGLESTAAKISMIIQVLTLIMATTDQDVEAESRSLSEMELDEDSMNFVAIDFDQRGIDPLYRGIAADVLEKLKAQQA